jgi:hypothetical protein
MSTGDLTKQPFIGSHFGYCGVAARGWKINFQVVRPKLAIFKQLFGKYAHILRLQHSRHTHATPIAPIALCTFTKQVMRKPMFVLQKMRNILHVVNF